MKILTIVGARPQFIKAVPLSRALQFAGIEEYLVHTGQHYDAGMSDIFFQDLNLRDPDCNLNVGSGKHGAQTGLMLKLLEDRIEQQSPDFVVVFGDTNSTLSGTLAAAKLHVPIAHIEAGLRSFNRLMPEEINRVVTDHLSTLLFVPTDTAVSNLACEGIKNGVIRTGDLMFDTVCLFRERFMEASGTVLKRYGLKKGKYAFTTIHRPENTENHFRWSSIIEALEELAAEHLKVIWPVHPRVRDRLAGYRAKGILLTPPVSYIETQVLIMNARLVLTDSGGLQKEAAFHKIPCVTLRDETEWVELVALGLNKIAGADRRLILETALKASWPGTIDQESLFGDGHTAERIVEVLIRESSSARSDREAL